jgi:large subunit ribosomal protein L21
MGAYAVIHTGGKQYRVSPGDKILVEKLPAQPGDVIELGRVYLLAINGQIITGNPVLKNTRVMAEVLDQSRGEKLIIFKHRRRKGYRKTAGHRQYATELKILEIVHEGTSYREQPEKQAHVQEPAAALKPAAVKKPDVPKMQKATKKRPENQPFIAAKPEKEVTPPPQAEKSKPVEQPVAQAAAPSPPPKLEEMPKESPVSPPAPLRKPEKRLFLRSHHRKYSPRAQTAIAENGSSQSSSRPWRFWSCSCSSEETGPRPHLKPAS